MTHQDFQILLHRVDSLKNMSRFYSRTLQSNLFGEASLVRRWGRIGTFGQTKIDLFQDEIAATKAMLQLAKIKRKRDYVSSITHK
ncbi:MAG: WGR domain-containing protein [Roseibium sp.]|uniref:WGR domain-containing protein n=1 Tax=Roseibium sp. TaxID=1936156 RepID=UPI0026320720|nr:WGR domain-containing protein [Roseibium sp.]MCV0426594.1 WGR domain-containing protein [Roseibium sp.]